MIATVELREGVGDTFVELGRTFGGVAVRTKVDGMFCAENEDGVEPKAEGMIEGCEAFLACTGACGAVEDDKNASKSSSSSNNVLDWAKLELLRGCTAFRSFEPNNGIFSFEYRLSVGADMNDAATRLSRIFSSSTSITCASRRASKSVEVI
jgi:hypothetical protein